MPTDPLSTLALATGGAFLGKFVGPAAESLGKITWERAQQLGQKAHQLLTTVGREPQPVEPKVLLPLVQAAALETNETLAEKWAALLANAADPSKAVEVTTTFVEVLRQLMPVDTTVLNWMYFPDGGNDSKSLSRIDGIYQISVEKLLPGAGRLAVDNLLRLRLCKLNGRIDKEKGPPLLPTEFGYQFMLACTPPTP